MSDLSPLPRGVAGLMDLKWSLDRPLTGVRGATLRCLHCMYSDPAQVDTHESGRSPSSVTVTVVVPNILTSR
ncbi:hypothetical protein QR685DRAFT_595176 [Neurospora intermedia]|uniref:Uncharacterized protein n=1 Tax=Neurospora intermedia TaxID=5142 RepID=A0ABR3DLA3_NEUIN